MNFGKMFGVVLLANILSPIVLIGSAVGVADIALRCKGSSLANEIQAIRSTAMEAAMREE